MATSTAFGVNLLPSVGPICPYAVQACVVARTGMEEWAAGHAAVCRLLVQSSLDSANPKIYFLDTQDMNKAVRLALQLGPMSETWPCFGK